MVVMPNYSCDEARLLLVAKLCANDDQAAKVATRFSHQLHSQIQPHSGVGRTEERPQNILRLCDSATVAQLAMK
jgi:hypothetical protein